MRVFTLAAAFLFLAVFLPAQTPPQMLAGVEAMSDFYTVYGTMTSTGKALTSAADLKPYLGDGIRQKLKNNLPYRVAFIGRAAAQAGFNAGQTSMNDIDGTVNALTGFLMLVEGNGDILTWTVKEVSQKYERLMQTSWQNTNPTLFVVILQSYCAYRRGELW
jgi:hypothetical protein